jgi:hypothetical protein
MRLAFFKCTASLLVCVAFAACSSSSSDDTKPQSDSPTTTPTGDAGARAPAALGTIRARVHYTGTVDGPLSVAVFTENPPKTRPPVAFSTSKTPSFPFDTEFTGIEPGTYWVFSVLDRPPVSSGTLRPSAEDAVGSSVQIDLAAGGTADVTVELGAGGDVGARDAGAD